MPTPKPNNPPTSSNDFITLHSQMSLSRTAAMFRRPAGRVPKPLCFQGFLPVASLGGGRFRRQREHFAVSAGG
jgi:hypothetical protein